MSLQSKQTVWIFPGNMFPCVINLLILSTLYWRIVIWSTQQFEWYDAGDWRSSHVHMDQLYCMFLNYLTHGYMICYLGSLLRMEHFCIYQNNKPIAHIMIRAGYQCRHAAITADGSKRHQQDYFSWPFVEWAVSISMCVVPALTWIWAQKLMYICNKKNGYNHKIKIGHIWSVV